MEYERRKERREKHRSEHDGRSRAIVQLAKNKTRDRRAAGGEAQHHGYPRLTDELGVGEVIRDEFKAHQPGREECPGHHVEPVGAREPFGRGRPAFFQTRWKREIGPRKREGTESEERRDEKQPIGRLVVSAEEEDECNQEGAECCADLVESGVEAIDPALPKCAGGVRRAWLRRSAYGWRDRFAPAG